MWACLEPCPLRENTGFVEDSSRSRKSVCRVYHIRIFLVVRIEALATTNCKREFAARKCQPMHVPQVNERRKPCPGGGGNHYLQGMITFLSVHRKGRGSVKASASGIGVHEVSTSGAGLGRREARRRGLWTAAVPNGQKDG
jgi:hypothetical protein